MSWTRKHLLDLESLSPAEITAILDTARSFKSVGERAIKKTPALRGKTVVNLFVEPSTRTRISFELAALRLSADVINFAADATGDLVGVPQGRTPGTHHLLSDLKAIAEAARADGLGINFVASTRASTSAARSSLMWLLEYTQPTPREPFRPMSHSQPASCAVAMVQLSMTASSPSGTLQASARSANSCPRADVNGRAGTLVIIVHGSLGNYMGGVPRRMAFELAHGSLHGLQHRLGIVVFIDLLLVGSNVEQKMGDVAFCFGIELLPFAAAHGH